MPVSCKVQRCKYSFAVRVPLDIYPTAFACDHWRVEYPHPRRRIELVLLVARTAILTRRGKLGDFRLRKAFKVLVLHPCNERKVVLYFKAL